MTTITTPEVCIWLTHRLTIYPEATSWNSVGGIYIMAARTGPLEWRALYVGKTNDFSVRLPGHETWPIAKRHGATHIHAMVIGTEAERLRIERQLILGLQPPLNDHLR